MAVPFLHNIDLNENQLLNAKVHTDTTAPSNPGTGSIWFDTNTNLLKIYRGGSWDNLFVKTEAIADAGTNLATADQIHTFVTNDTLTLANKTLTTPIVSGDLTINNSGDLKITNSDNTSGRIYLGDTSGTQGSSLIDSSHNLEINFGTTANDSILYIQHNGSNVGIFTASGFKLATGATVNTILDSGDTFADNDTSLMTAAAIADYVTSQVTLEDLDFQGDSGGALSIDLDSETLTIAGGTYITTAGASNTLTVNHDATSRSDTTSTDAPSYGGTFEAVTGVTTNATGHVTAIDVSTVTIPASDNTDVDVSKANLKTRLASMDSTDTVYIGDADDDTTVVIRGDLQVDGTTTTVNSETLTIDDNKIVLNSNSAATPTEDAGIEIERGDSTNVELRWNESNDDWEFQAYDHAVDPALQTYGIPRSYKTTVGGSTSATVSHNLGTRDVIVQLYDTSSYDTVYADVVRTNASTVTLSFGTAPAAGDVTVLVMTVG